jgi:hypothetical protein
MKITASFLLIASLCVNTAETSSIRSLLKSQNIEAQVDAESKLEAQLGNAIESTLANYNAESEALTETEVDDILDGLKQKYLD